MRGLPRQQRALLQGLASQALHVGGRLGRGREGRRPPVGSQVLVAEPQGVEVDQVLFRVTAHLH